MQKNLTEVLEEVQKSFKTIEGFSKFIDSSKIEKIRDFQRSFKNDVKSKQEINRLLRIGIVGQVKRGKSSFLNALLFDNKDILPKAATPMTASLTKIRYAKKPYAIIEFYTKKDFEDIVQTAIQAKAKEENEDFDDELREEEKACLEIYESTKESQILSKLGTKEKIESKEEIEDILEKLQKYVGADGIYTYVVKSMELGVNIDSIKNIEIVDTPGTNDPVISRGRVTQEFIGECDVVFFLSSSSQFLDESDMEVLGQNLPSKGIDNIYIVASLFDGVLLDEYEKFNDVETLIKNTQHSISKRVEDDIKEMILRDGNDHIYNALLNALPPIFISSMCSNIAKDFDELNEEEKHIYTSLNSMYHDTFDKEDMQYIANIESIEEKIQEVHNQKDKILSEALSKLLKGVIQRKVQIYTEILNEAKNDLEILNNSDIPSLEKKQKKIQSQIEKGTKSIDSIFESYSIDVEKKLTSLISKIKTKQKEASHVETHTETSEESYVYTEMVEQEGISGSLKRGAGSIFGQDDWGYDEVSETRSKTVSYKYADSYEQVEKLEAFVNSSEALLSEKINNLINIEHFRVELQKSLVNLFDMEDENFDPQEMKRVVLNAVNRITIPNIEIDASMHIETIRDEFSLEEVTGSDISRLKDETKRVAKLIEKDIIKEIYNHIELIVKDLEKVKENFLPELLKDSESKVEQMKNSFSKLEESKVNYKKLITILEEEI